MLSGIQTTVPRPGRKWTVPEYDMQHSGEEWRNGSAYPNCDVAAQLKPAVPLGRDHVLLEVQLVLLHGSFPQSYICIHESQRLLDFQIVISVLRILVM